MFDEEWQKQVEWIHGDFSDLGIIRRAMNEMDVVFHLISTTLPATSNDDVGLDVSSNILPTLQMMEAARTAGLRKVIYISSGGAIYGIPKALPITEDHPTNPICAYGIHKLAIEKYLHLFHYLWKMEYGILRISNPYGIDQPINRPQGVIASFLHKVIHHEPLDVWGDGSVIRDYIHINDVIDACLLLIGHQGASRVFNIGTGQGHSLMDLIQIIERLTGKPVSVGFRKSRPVDVPINVLDITRAITELHWRPTTEIEDGMRRMLEHFMKRRKASTEPRLAAFK